MDFTFIEALIEQYGLVLALVTFTVVNGVLMLRSARRAADKASEAESAERESRNRQQDAITEQFTKLSDENRRLQARLDSVEDGAAQMAHDLDEARKAQAATADELRKTKEAADAAQIAYRASVEKSAALEKELAELRAKVLQLEAERTARTDELKKETERATKLEREVHDLRARVARLEGENGALHQVLDKLNVVSVKGPDPDPPPTPPTARVIPLAEDKAEDKAA